VSLSGARARAWRLALALCGLVVAIDQGTKAAIEAELAIGERVEVFPGVHLTDVHNEGIAFGLAGGGGTAVIVLVIVAIGLILALFAHNADRRGIWIPIGLLIGGALGNLADRVRIESVTDFIDLPAWPAFNLADVAIVFGVAGLGLVFMEEQKE
jgi:signal peptidase II